MSSILTNNGAMVALQTLKGINSSMAKTQDEISTGKSENKFGIPIARAREVYARAAALPGLQVVGIDMHIGSQLTDLEPYRQAYGKMADLCRTLRGDGHAPPHQPQHRVPEEVHEVVGARQRVVRVLHDRWPDGPAHAP